jgi:CRISPR-associated protein Cas2
MVAYDIADPKRLRGVHKVMKQHGWAMQYSVFICDLDDIELFGLKTAIADIIHHTQDRVAIIDVGRPDERGRACFSFMGAPTPLPVAGPVVL